METSPLLVKGCKIWSYAQHLEHLRASMDVYRATPAVKRGLTFPGLILRISPIQSPLTTHKGMWRINSNSDPHGLLPRKCKHIAFVLSICYTLNRSNHNLDT